MFKFLEYVKTRESDKEDIKNTINKLPKEHQSLVKNFDVDFHKGNTLNGSKKYVGSVDNKKIELSGAWNYGREFVFLHEVGHKVWESLKPEQRKEWKKLTKTIEDKPEQNDEELFCMLYANHFVKHKVKTYDINKLKKFIKDILD